MESKWNRLEMWPEANFSCVVLEDGKAISLDQPEAVEGTSGALQLASLCSMHQTSAPCELLAAMM